MTADPHVVLLYAWIGLVVTAALLVVVCIVYLLSQIGSAQNLGGLTGFLGWWVKDGKTHAVSILIAGVTAAYALGYVTEARALILLGLLNGAAFSTLRAGVTKSTKAAQAAGQAVEEAVTLATTRPPAPITPKRVDLEAPTGPTPKDL
jgi:hypothetical protein